MIRHIVWWTLKDRAEGASAAENARKMKEMLESLKDSVPSVNDMEVVVDFLPSTTEPVGVLLVTTHDGTLQLKEYAEDPEHARVVEFVRKVVATRKAIDYEV